MSEAEHHAESDRYRKSADQAADAVVDALCHTYTKVSGKQATDRMRDEFWKAVRYE